MGTRSAWYDPEPAHGRKHEPNGTTSSIPEATNNGIIDRPIYLAKRYRFPRLHRRLGISHRFGLQMTSRRATMRGSSMSDGFARHVTGRWIPLAPCTQGPYDVTLPHPPGEGLPHSRAPQRTSPGELFRLSLSLAFFRSTQHHDGEITCFICTVLQHSFSSSACFVVLPFFLYIVFRRHICWL